MAGCSSPDTEKEPSRSHEAYKLRTIPTFSCDIAYAVSLDTVRDEIWNQVAWNESGGLDPFLCIDWTAGRVRVRQNYVRGHWGTPKSRRGSRSVPLADRVAGQLERHFQASAYQADDDLVFPHPHAGNVLDHSQLSRRYKKALRKAKVRVVRFNDLRHTFGTRLAAAGVPLRTLQDWMGHRDFKTTLIYAD